MASDATSKIEDVVKQIGSSWIKMIQPGDTHACWYSEAQHRNWEFPHVFVVWTGSSATAPDAEGITQRIVGIGRLGASSYGGFQVLKSGSTTKYDPVKGADKFLQWQKSFFKGFVPVATSYQMEATGEMSLLGRNQGIPAQDQVMVRFYTSDGQWRDVYQNGTVAFDPEVRVDKYLRTNFKYGTWYYNASAVKPFADRFNIPVLIEYSSEGCDPCDYFKKNVYRDKTFQDWVAGMKCLFVRIEIKSGQKWDDPAAFPEPYFVDHEWVGEGSVSIPVFCWYWNKGGDQAPVKITQTYHFSPGDQNPPFSMQDIMLSTEQIFSGYVPKSEFEKVPVTSLYNTNLCVVLGRTYENRPLTSELSTMPLQSCLSAYDWGYLGVKANPPFTQAKTILENNSRGGDEGDFKSLSVWWELTNTQDIDNFVMNYLSTEVYLGEFDPNGVYFPCDEKTRIDFISAYMTVRDIQGTDHVLSAGAISVGTVPIGISGEIVPDGTYQFYDFDSSNLYRYDQRGFIFKVLDGKTHYAYRFENDYGQILGIDDIQKFSQRTMYEFSDGSSGEDMLKFITQCEADGSKVAAVYFVGQGDGVAVADTSEVRQFVQTNSGYYAKVIS